MENQKESDLLIEFERMKKNEQKCNFYVNFKEKLELLELLVKKAYSVPELSEATKFSTRSIHRQIEHLKMNGWKFIRNEFAQYRIIGVPSDFSEMVSDLFHIIHKIKQSNQ